MGERERKANILTSRKHFTNVYLWYRSGYRDTPCLHTRAYFMIHFDLFFCLSEFLIYVKTAKQSSHSTSIQLTGGLSSSRPCVHQQTVNLVQVSGFQWFLGFYRFFVGFLGSETGKNQDAGLLMSLNSSFTCCTSIQRFKKRKKKWLYRGVTVTARL